MKAIPEHLWDKLAAPADIPSGGGVRNFAFDAAAPAAAAAQTVVPPVYRAVAGPPRYVPPGLRPPAPAAGAAAKPGAMAKSWGALRAASTVAGPAIYGAGAMGAARTPESPVMHANGQVRTNPQNPLWHDTKRALGVPTENARWQDWAWGVAGVPMGAPLINRFANIYSDKVYGDTMNNMAQLSVQQQPMLQRLKQQNYNGVSTQAPAGPTIPGTNVPLFDGKTLNRFDTWQAAQNRGAYTQAARDELSDMQDPSTTYRNYRFGWGPNKHNIQGYGGIADAGVRGIGHVWNYLTNTGRDAANNVVNAGVKQIASGLGAQNPDQYTVQTDKGSVLANLAQAGGNVFDAAWDTRVNPRIQDSARQATANSINQAEQSLKDVWGRNKNWAIPTMVGAAALPFLWSAFNNMNQPQQGQSQGPQGAAAQPGQPQAPAPEPYAMRLSQSEYPTR